VHQDAGQPRGEPAVLVILELRITMEELEEVQDLQEPQVVAEVVAELL
jgi:hypothetical protein